MKYIIVILSLSLISCNGTNKGKKEKEYLRHVGDIPIDKKLDDPMFVPCNEHQATMHYAFEDPNLYKGEKPAIVNAFKNISFAKDPEMTGYITIRFMVNCEGKIGRFRVEQLDTEYKPKKFNVEFVEAILSTTKSLNGWIPATRNNKAYDYYKYLTFKIIENEIVDILP